MNKSPHSAKKKLPAAKVSVAKTGVAKNNTASNKVASKAAKNTARVASLKTLKQVFDGQSLSVAQKQWLDKLDDHRDRGLANEIVNGVLRWRWQLEFYASQLLSKPLKAKDCDVQIIILMALYELTKCRTPDYAIINEAVEQVKKSKKKWASSLVNAVLRRFTREHEKLLALKSDDSVSYSHPEWLLQKIKNDWPDHWQTILEANNTRPAFWLRVNQAQIKTTEYKQLLEDDGLETELSSLGDSAIKLSQGLDVTELPDFSQGAVSVQDAGAQLAADLLNASAGQRVLDLCAAPGGKTCHILELSLEPGMALEQLVVVELDEQRMQRVCENLQRLKLYEAVSPGEGGSDKEGTGKKGVSLITADAREYKDWWHGELFDRILIDAPCSASGVIRRHPDIKSLRRESDIEKLVELQAEILTSAWQMLAVGGELLYVTCSVFKDENQRQMKDFFNKNKNVVELKIDEDWGESCQYGRQLFPGEQDADGFYFCRLTKITEQK